MAFTVHSRLGRGRTVDAYSATLSVGEERLEVVVKRPRSEWAKDDSFRQAFLQWGQAQVDVDHDHVVAVLEVGETEEGAFAIQEDVDGVALGELLKVLRKKRRTLTSNHALVIGSRIASGLAFLHGSGTSHGGLGPDTVWVSYSGDVKVADQGLHVLINIVDVPPLDADDPSLAYLPPEVKKGSPPDARSDVYTFALILLETLIGHPVWASGSMTVEDALAALRDFTQLGQATPKLTEELVKVLAPCLESRPADRPADASLVANGLSALIRKHNITADDEGLGEFVDAVLPKLTETEAATVMVDPAEAERLAQRRARATDWDVASVLINPEIERRAQEALKSSRGQGIELVAASVSLNEATPAGLEKAARVAAERSASQARSPRADSVAPVAPSLRRNQAEGVPDVAQVAARAQASFEGDRKKIIWAGLLGLALTILVILAIASGDEKESGGSEVRTVQVRATSVPSKASLFVDGEFIGQTPIDRPVSARGELIRLRFELSGYEPHEVSIGTPAEELRYEAPMKPLDSAP